MRISRCAVTGNYYVHYKHFTERLNVKTGYDGKRQFIVFDNELDCTAFALDVDEVKQNDIDLVFYDFNGDSNALSLPQVVAALGYPL